VSRGDDTANEHALHKTQDEKDDRCNDTNLMNGWQSAKSSRAQADADHRHRHRAFATVRVGVVAEDCRADWAHEQGHRK
jgi:hypothetical protein